MISAMVKLVSAGQVRRGRDPEHAREPDAARVAPGSARVAPGSARVAPGSARVAPGSAREFVAGQDGPEVLAFGARSPGCCEPVAGSSSP